MIAARLFGGLRRRGAATFAAAFLLIAPGSAAAIDIEDVTSPGGIKAWLVEDNTVPIVAVDIAFASAGSIQDPEGQAGRARLLASLLDEGAGDLGSVDFQTELRDSAVRLSFEASRDHFYGDLRTISSSIERGFELLRLALTEPRFDNEAMVRMKTQLIQSLRRESQDPGAVVADLWSRTAFPDHPYGTPRNGTEESLTAITRDDLAQAAQTLLARDNLVIAVVGDIDAETLGPLLDTAFASLPESAELVTVSDVQPAMGLSVSETLQTPQTAIRFGGPGLKREDPDFIPAFVMNHILGGGSFSSWLFEEVREKRGLAYSVYSYMAPFEHTAIFGGGTATRNDQADEALSVIMAQMEKMAAEGPSAEELRDAKDYLTGSYALRFGSSGSIARQLLFLQMEDLGKGYIDERNDLIEAVTLEDVRRAASRILGEGAPTVAIVRAGE